MVKDSDRRADCELQARELIESEYAEQYFNTGKTFSNLGIEA